MSQNNFDFGKLFNGQIPNVDVKALIDAQNRNFEAMVKVGRIFADTAQSLIKRQVEIAEANLKDSAESAKAVLAVKDLPATLNMQAELAKTTADKVSAQVRELSEIAAKGGREAYSVISSRTQESVAELKALTVSKAA
ncbi:phasin family protein [Skermanella mucosa]|uniref:phasin family protein n=1 Tax=Skermanella mucosa TaxID=1789672 RepID=UPI00192BE3DA|nr:phasin family protein [Skermanella mucosa]UEM19951.1 phasin family protein [Skermanella mucosa]